MENNIENIQENEIQLFADIDICNEDDLKKYYKISNFNDFVMILNNFILKGERLLEDIKYCQLKYLNESIEKYKEYRRLFEKFRTLKYQKELTYKMPEDLEKALNSDTDIDILIDYKNKIKRIKGFNWYSIEEKKTTRYY